MIICKNTITFKINDDTISIRTVDEYSIPVNMVSLNDDRPLNGVFLDSTKGPSLVSVPKDMVDELFEKMFVIQKYCDDESIENLLIYDVSILSSSFWLVFNGYKCSALGYSSQHPGFIQQTVYIDNVDVDHVICLGPCLFCGKNFTALSVDTMNSIVNSIKFTKKGRMLNSSFSLDLHDLYNTLKEEKNVQ